ncbi:PP2C family protein-serine/threonine phosphatase [Streptomyces sp. KR80]|uniref:PP2C family protein-serine/threonine phosphatase n=1 Tax=Streptomyces sp. KR80 TaxID=3457426 RepID=UPI003FD0012C
MALNRPRPPATADELLQTLGHLAGRIDERIKLQQAHVDLAVALQRSLLPGELPNLPGLQTAARYAPARAGLDIGGDWYDVFPMPDGTLAFAIGDVEGHGVEAAAVMGQVRIGLRAIAFATTDPGEVLGRTSDLLLSMGSGLFVTCSFLRFDPATAELTASRAGHVPAVWSMGRGSSTVVLDEGGLPLGILPGENYPVTRHLLTEEGAFVLFTDGVVEGPSCPIERGLESVTRLVRAGFDADADELAEAVIRVADMTGHTDDAAVLVLRHGELADSGG